MADRSGGSVTQPGAGVIGSPKLTSIRNLTVAVEIVVSMAIRTPGVERLLADDARGCRVGAELDAVVEWQISDLRHQRNDRGLIVGN